MPTNVILYARQTRVHAEVNFCISIPRVFLFLWHIIFTDFHETGLKIVMIPSHNLPFI